MVVYSNIKFHHSLGMGDKQKNEKPQLEYTAHLWPHFSEEHICRNFTNLTVTPANLVVRCTARANGGYLTLWLWNWTFTV